MSSHRLACRGPSMKRRMQRGFTLTELMVVVTLVGILAAIGIASFRKQVRASKTSEASSVVQAIRGAEEAFRSENQLYLDVSSPGSWYPTKGIGPVVATWEQKAHTDLAAWQRLGVRVTQPVQFGYMVNAGRAGDNFPKLNLTDTSVNLGKPTDVWYVIQARADYDNDGVFCNVLAASHTPELFVENEGE
ncbi:MAG: type IV pilin protein [Myxococcota bacterium]